MVRESSCFSGLSTCSSLLQTATGTDAMSPQLTGRARSLHLGGEFAPEQTLVTTHSALHLFPTRGSKSLPHDCTVKLSRSSERQTNQPASALGALISPLRAPAMLFAFGVQSPSSCCLSVSLLACSVNTSFDGLPTPSDPAQHPS